MSQQMKTSVLTVALMCITFCLPQIGLAQDAKIAVVDTQALTVGSDEGKIDAHDLIWPFRLQVGLLSRPCPEPDFQAFRSVRFLWG